MDSPQYVWLVVGETGSGDSWVNWQVAAYTNEETARRHCGLLNGWLFANGIHVDSPGEDWPKGAWNLKNPYDRDMSLANGVSYAVERIPLVRHVDEYLEHHHTSGPVVR